MASLPQPIQPRHLCLLDLDPVILMEIMKYLFPPKTVDFVSVPDGPPGQTSYLTDYTSQVRSTYMTTTKHFKSRALSQILDDEPEPTNFATSFLLASRECYNLGTPHLYNREFSFPSCAETPLAFLHDHARAQVHRGIKIHLKFGEQTTPEAWKNLFNVLVHERHVKRIKVTIIEDFWQHAPWTYGINAVWHSLPVLKSGREKKGRSWIEHLARLPMKARFGETWLGGPSPGVDFSLEILGSERSLAKKAFADHLDLAVYNRSNYDQRSQVRMEDKSGYCEVTWLEYSCHWDMEVCCCRGDFWDPYRRRWIKVNP